MRTRSSRPLVALAGAAILSLGLIGSALAQEEASPSPSPDVALELRLERQAEQEAAREERKAARDERKAERDANKVMRKAERDAIKEERKALIEQSKIDQAAKREGRKAVRTARRAALAQVKDACATGLQAVWTDAALDRAARREALWEARTACKELYLATRIELLDVDDGDEPIDELYSEAASDGSGVVRTDLGIAEPGSALGQELGLWHYLIPAQTALAPHTHPGWQLARITAGELEYTVLEGEGILLRADGSQEPMGPGTYVLATGDGVIENPLLVHLGANRTDEPVTLISATLFEAGQPISTLVEEAEEPVAAG